jgi:peptidoglycan-N-acetylglucosamine deacetylase
VIVMYAERRDGSSSAVHAPASTVGGVSRSHPIRVGGAVAGTVAAVTALAHAGPALAAVGPLRRGLLPTYAGRGASDHVALTFDDGPHRLSTPRFLDLLERHDVRATFFVLGSSLARDLPLGREMAARGHELAVHGWDHRVLVRRGPVTVGDDLRRARDLVDEASGRPPRWYRPPYGVASTSALRTARELGMAPVLWTAWGRDWTRGATSGSVRRAVLRVPQGGGTVLLHDADTCSAPGSWHATITALPDLLRSWSGMGLRVGPLGEHRVGAGSPSGRGALTHF